MEKLSSNNRQITYHVGIHEPSILPIDIANGVLLAWWDSKIVPEIIQKNKYS